MSTRALIINADDLGYDPAVTRGILQAMRDGIVSSASLLVNTPFSEASAHEAEGLSLGLHLNLARGTPVWSDFPRELLGANGNFVESRAASMPAEVVEAETRAQLERFTALTGRPATHVDVHMHLHLQPTVLEGLSRVAREMKLPVRSIDSIMRHALKAQGIPTNTHFLGDTGSDAYWTLERLEAELVSLPSEGIIELMCHPGYRPETVKSGYGAQREVELATFQNPRARETLSRLGITPVDYRVLTPAS
ncbi:ChbG/HpnK family deacetylase [Myxococcus sp. CA051A]|uniref:carbohydrate deacetylase n=1 Tax=unclassified Myxococcus TaxID=2648731 RepID=UPI00157ADAC5|nr:ChbG/HpnK family deacetylase [Myxococcus sp. CA039A]NTX65798.1 ChbG/HpnK family deacetylase [Myxococcus sp. CA051A]